MNSSARSGPDFSCRSNLWTRGASASAALDNAGRERPRRRIEKTQLALVLTLRFARQLLNAIEWHLLGLDQ